MNYREQYQQQGYLSPIDIIDVDAALRHRRALESAEARLGPLHYEPNMHTILTAAAELAGQPAILDVVEQLIGPDILVYNTTYIVKEARSAAHVSWHRDLTYWGLDRDDQVSLWLALSTASVDSGCMRVLPGSHLKGRLEHITGERDENNILYQNQRVADVDEAYAVACELMPGQASLHHGWLLHASTPNLGDDRRIGFNVQYISPEMRQTKLPGYTAWLVRGEDRFGNYPPEQPASVDLDPQALAWREKMQKLHREITANP
jgi:hypothetical protein